MKALVTFTSTCEKGIIPSVERNTDYSDQPVICILYKDRCEEACSLKSHPAMCQCSTVCQPTQYFETVKPTSSFIHRYLKKCNTELHSSLSFIVNFIICVNKINFNQAAACEVTLLLDSSNTKLIP